MARKRPTIADVRAMKGKQQYTMLRVESMEEAEAAELAGIDMASVPPELMRDPQFRDAAPDYLLFPASTISMWAPPMISSAGLSA